MNPAPTPGQPSAAQRAQGLRLLALDVDGTLTDGALFIGPGGEAMKAFSVRDGFGITLLRQAGLEIALVTGRRSTIVEQRAAELRIAHVRQAAGDKAAVLRALCADLAIPLEATAFMGDDWPDLPAMAIAGLALAPADADEAVRARAHWVATRAGGHGAVREFAHWWLACRGLLEPMRQTWLSPADAPAPPS